MGAIGLLSRGLKQFALFAPALDPLGRALFRLRDYSIANERVGSDLRGIPAGAFRLSLLVAPNCRPESRMCVAAKQSNCALLYENSAVESQQTIGLAPVSRARLLDRLRNGNAIFVRLNELPDRPEPQQRLQLR